MTELVALNARWLIGARGTVIEDATLLFEGDRIVASGSRSELEPLAREAQVHEYGDSTILPGLIDSHVHVTFPADGSSYDDQGLESDEYLAMVGVANADKHLAAGVTTMRDNGSRNRTAFAVRDYLARRKAPASRLLVAGRPVTPTGGHLHWLNGAADGVEGVRHAVRKLAGEGADHIKLVASGGGTRGTFPFRPSYTTVELRAGVEAAHELGLLTAAHCHACIGIERAVEAGVDSIEHASFVVEDKESPETSGMAVNYDPRLVERIAESDCYINVSMLGDYETSLALRARVNAGDILTDQERAELVITEAHVQRKLDVFSGLVRDGFHDRLVINTDAGPGVTRFGALHRCLELAVLSGLSPIQAIATITRIAAEACGQKETIGSLEAGKTADILVVQGNAPQDVRALGDVVAIFRNGEPVTESGTGRGTNGQSDRDDS